MASKAGPTPPSRAIETRYRLSLTALVKRTWRRLVGSPDADVSDLLTRYGLPAVEAFVAQSDKYNIRRFVKMLEHIGGDRQMRALGADVRAALDAAKYENVRLITKMTDLQRDVISKEISAVSEIPLSTRLSQRTSIPLNRAALIARDQTAKLNSTLSHERALAAGAERYEWSTSGDERVRKLHRELDGKEYRVGEPTGAEGGDEPGIPVACRCVHLWVFD